MGLMVFEIRSIEDYNLADIVIVDLNNITVGHAVKYTLPVLKKLEISVIVSSRKYSRSRLILKQVIPISNIRIVLALPVDVFLLYIYCLFCGLTFSPKVLNIYKGIMC
jgi:hypothetical protein